eukprot:3831767-Amphidinium_carterae.1
MSSRDTIKKNQKRKKSEISSFRPPPTLSGPGVWDTQLWGDSLSLGQGFLKLAKSRLPMDTYHQLLASVERLSKGQQTREYTMEETWHLFGEQQQDTDIIKWRFCAKQYVLLVESPQK